MAFVAVVLGAILVLTPRHSFRAQAETASIESANSSTTVKALGGLSIRNQPNVNSTVLTTAPNHATLLILDENVASDNIGGKSGSWYKVEYQGVTGYAWGNYIEK